MFAGYDSEKILQDRNHTHLKIVFILIIIYFAFKLVLRICSMMLILKVGVAIIWHYGEQPKTYDTVKQNQNSTETIYFPYSDVKQNYFYFNI